MRETLIIPGATTAGDDIDLDISLNELSSVYFIDVGEYSSGADAEPEELTIVDDSPSAGEVALEDSTTLELGDDTNIFTILLVKGVQTGSQVLTA